jgi:hypothetical protein
MRHEKSFIAVQTPPIPIRDHSKCCLAVSSLQSEQPRHSSFGRLGQSMTLNVAGGGVLSMNQFFRILYFKIVLGDI